MSKTEKAAEWMKVDDLIPWAQNPRVNDLAVSEVSVSIKRFGFGAPIIARKADNMVIAGHTRLKAAKKLGLEHVPVRFLDLDLVDAKLLALADNKLNEVAEWDDDRLAEIMRDIDPKSLAGLGWTDEELNNLTNPAISIDEAFGYLPSGEPPFKTMTFNIPESLHDKIVDTFRLVGSLHSESKAETLHRLCEAFNEG